MEIEWNSTKNTNTNTTLGSDHELPWEGHSDYDLPTIDPHYVRIQTLLNIANPDLDYDEWKKIIRLIYLETDGAEEGFGYALEWSEKCVFGHDHDFIVSVWGYEADPH